MSDTNRARRLGFAVVPLAAVALIVPGVAMASASSTTAASKTMAGCLKGGVLTKVAVAAKPAKKCKTGYTKVVWNIKGAKGDKGATGATGAKGATGATGAKGASGLQGLQGVPGAKGEKGDSGLPGLQGIQGLVGAAGAAGSDGSDGADGTDGVSGYQVVEKVVGSDLTGTVGGFGNPVKIACPAGKSALSGGVIPSPASLTTLNGLLGPLSLLSAGGLLNTVTSVVGGVPLSLPSADVFQMITPVVANAGDTFYAVCVTATSAAG